MEIFFTSTILTTSPNNIKRAILSSKIYETGPELLSDRLVVTSESPNKDAIKQSLKRMFPPDILQESTEAVINQIFLWLNGKADNPIPTMQIVKAPNEISHLSNLVIQEHTSNLHPCGQKELNNTISLPLRCRPTNILTIDQLLKLFNGSDDTTGIKQLFKSGTLSPALIPIAPETTKKIQRAYSLYKNFPFILLGSILTLLFLAYLLTPKRYFVGLLGISLIIPSTLHLVGALAALSQYQELVDSISLYSDKETLPSLAQETLHEFMTPLVRTFLFDTIYISIAILIVGAICIIYTAKHRNEAPANSNGQLQTPA